MLEGMYQDVCGWQWIESEQGMIDADTFYINWSIEMTLRAIVERPSKQ